VRPYAALYLAVILALGARQMVEFVSQVFNLVNGLLELGRLIPDEYQAGNYRSKRHCRLPKCQ
jgi:hypothetical protein